MSYWVYKNGQYYRYTGDVLPPITPDPDNNTPKYGGIILHEKTSSPGEGLALYLGVAKNVNIKIAGTSTSRKLLFEVAGFDGEYEPIQGYRPKDGIMASETTENGESWQFDVTGFIYFRVRVESIAGGYVTIKGRAVS